MTRRLSAIFLSLGALGLLGLLGVARAVPLQVLLVTASTTLGVGDAAVKARLEATGYAVEVRPAGVPNVADVTGKDLVVISSTAPAAAVGATFKNISIGVLTWQSGIFDDMAMTGTVANTDFGTATHFTEVVFSPSAPSEQSPADSRNPGSLSAYLPRVPGVITVTSAQGPFSWGIPGASAMVIAALGDSPKATIFAYEEGKLMVGTQNPPKFQARRVGFFMTDLTAASFIDDGWNLFDAAVAWVRFKNTPPTVSAGSDVTVDPRDYPSGVPLAGIATDDSMPFPTALGVTWTKVTGAGAIAFSPATEPNTAANLPNPSTPGATDPYTLRLSATDGLTTVSDEMILNVRYAQNRAPAVNPGTYLPWTFGASLALTGSAVDEGLPVGGSLTYAWSNVSGPGTVTFGNVSLASTSATFGAPGPYVLRLCATDGSVALGGLTGCMDTAITVNPHALLVVGSALNLTGDTAIKNRLQSLGYAVTVKTSPVVGAADANNKNIVVIAATAVDANVTTKFKSSAQGVVVLKHSLLDNMAMTGATSGTHFGTSATPQTQVAITNPTDRLAAGLSGTVTVTSAAATYTWGAPPAAPATPITVATLATDGTKATVFRYSRDAPMFGGFGGGVGSHGPRVAFFAQDAAVNALTPNGGWLFDAALGWAASVNLNPRADAGPDRSQVLQLPLGSSVTLDGRCVDDGMPGPCTFQWADVTPLMSGRVCPATQGSPTADNLTLQFFVADHCRFRLTVSDGVSAWDEVDVYVSDPNVPPLVSLSAPSSVLVLGTADLVATVVDDGLPSPPGATTLAWSKASGPGPVVFTPTGQFTATATFSIKGTYVVQVTASDGALSGSATATLEARQSALLVIGDTADPADTVLASRLSGLGFEVTVAGATAASATGKSVVVISPTTVAADVATKFNTVTVPVVTMNEALFDDNRLTTAANLGSLTGQTTVSIAVPSHPLAAGFLGSARVTTALSSFAWGVPAAAAVKVATLASDSTKATVFCYEQGSAMTSGTAQRRRVGLFLRSDTVTKLNAKGASLFDAAVSWAATENLAPRVTLPATLSVPLKTPLSLSGVVTDDGLPLGSPVTVKWTNQSVAGTATFVDDLKPSTSVTLCPTGPITLCPAGPYVLRLTAFDGQLSAFAEVTVNTSATNQDPIVNAGPDLTDLPDVVGSVTIPNGGQLVGTAVDDGLPSPLVASWSKVAGPGTVTFATPSSPVTAVTFDARGRYLLRLCASDGAATICDDVIVDVNANAVLITAAATPDAVESAVKSRLEALGFSVGVVAAATSTYSVADNQSLVFISPSVADADVTTKFRTVTAPVITAKATLLDDMALVANSTSRGTVATQTSIVISTPAHPLASGLTGTVSVLSPSTTLGWGIAGANAAKVATQVGQTTHATLFGYEKGVALAVSGVTAAAQRVGFLFCVPANLNANGWVLFDAAVRWATSMNAPPRVVVGADQVITLPATTTVAGTVIFDDGQPAPPGVLTLAWTVEAGPADVGFSSQSAASTSVTFSSPGDYVLRLSASDGSLTGSDQLTVVVRPSAAPPNERPYVSAGVDQTIRRPNTATLAGLVSDDGLPLGSTALTTWSKVLGPGTVTFGNASQTQTTATFSAAGNYVLRLTANDSGAVSLCSPNPLAAGCARDDVTVVVEASKKVLLVVPNAATLTAGEIAIRNRLVSLAFTVTVADDNTADLQGPGETQDLVFVSHADPLVLTTKLLLAKVPVIVSKATSYPDMGMADSDVPGVEFGEDENVTQITITNPDLPLAAGLSGTIEFTTAPATVGFAGKLLDDWKAGEIPPDTLDKGSLFGYEKGTTMLAARVAPAKRVGFPNAEGSLFTPQAWQLFDAAVRWATERVVPALYVTGSCGSGYDEKETLRHLAIEGYAVTHKADTTVVAADASSVAVVVISRSVCAATLGTKLRDVAVPVITFDPENFAVMQMTGGVLGDDYGTTPNQNRLNVLDRNHPLAGRQTGVIDVLSASNGDFGWALPAASAARVAVTVGFSYGATVFGYEKGAEMVGMTAPSRRIGLYMNENSVQKFMSPAWAIFDAALRWAGAEDADNDGLSTFDEFRLGTDPTNPDTNGDGVPDGAQAFTGRGATNLDMDADGLTNAVELQKGTDPFNPDTDGDGVLDGVDCFPLDPTRSTCLSPTPGDTTPPIINLTEPKLDPVTSVP